MSDDFHRPTLTFPSGAYNATQVRLYGIAAKGGLIFAGQKQTFARSGVNMSVEASDNTQVEINKAKAELKKHKLSEDQVIPNIISGNIVWPPLIPIAYSYQLPVDIKDFGSVVISVVSTISDVVKTGKQQSCGIIVGYSYEGHCYDLPKPKIMLLPTNPVQIPADDCGYSAKNDKDFPDRYMLWIVDKLDECVEFEVNQGFVEQLVLEANLPGKRSPTMYASRAMMGHRSGRLTD